MYEYIIYKKELTDEYLAAFDKAQLYVEVYNLSGKDIDEALNNLLDMLLAAQNDKKPVSKIVGNDIERFCKSYFSEYDIKSKLLLYAQALYRMAWVIFVIEAIELIALLSAQGNDGIWDINTDITGYIYGFAVTYIAFGILLLILKPFVFKSKKLTADKMENVSCIVLFICIIAAIMLPVKFDLMLEMPLLPLLIAAAFYIIIYFIARSVYRFRSYGSIRKKKEKGEFTYSDVFKESLKEGMLEGTAEGLLKKYNSMKNRAEKKGREYTIEEYTKKFEKSLRFEKKIDKYSMRSLWVYPWLVVAVVYFFEGYEDYIDVLVFFIIMCIVTVVMVRPWFKLCNKVTNERVEFYEKAKEKGVDIITYAESIIDTNKL